MIEGDGNLHALDKYMEEIEKAEINLEYYLSDMDSTLGNLVDDIIYLHRIICEKYDVDEDLIKYIKER